MDCQEILAEGIAKHQVDDFTTASEIYQRVIDLEPNNADAWHLLGVASYQQNKLGLAKQKVLQALAIQPQELEYYISLANIYLQMGEWQNALQQYQYVYQQNPNHRSALLGIANTYQKYNELDKAAEYYQRCIDLNPSWSLAYNNYANVLRQQNKLKLAVEIYKQALRYTLSKTQEAEIFYNLAMLAIEIGDLPTAINSLTSNCQIKPVTANLMQLYILLMENCEWHKASNINNLLQQQGTDSSLPSPFLQLFYSNSPLKQAQCAIRWADQLAANNRLLYKRINKTFPDTNDQHKVLTIGYLSCDWHDHATTHLMMGLLREHDHRKFKILVFSYTPINMYDNYTYAVKSHCDEFIDISALSHMSAADEIANYNVDILIDLKMYTLGSRPEICLQRPAPIIANYLGYPGTSGNDCYDYIIADQITIPPQHRKFYTEQVAYLPYCYQPNDNLQPISKLNLSKEDYNLPTNTIVFASFNQPKKINKELFTCWLEILSEVPNSVLWLGMFSASAQDNIRTYCSELKVNQSRIIFTQRSPKDIHLQRLQFADVILDSLTYNGHTSTADALYAGVPVITTLGTSFATRVAASLLYNIGMPELVAKNLQGYKELAINLGLNPHIITNLKLFLQAHKKSKPLLNTSLFTREFENCLHNMYHAKVKAL